MGLNSTNKVQFQMAQKHDNIVSKMHKQQHYC